MKSSLEMEQVRFELMSQSVPTASQKSTSEKVLSEPTGGEGTEVDLSAQADDITKEQERPNSSKAGTLIVTQLPDAYSKPTVADKNMDSTSSRSESCIRELLRDSDEIPANKSRKSEGVGHDGTNDLASSSSAAPCFDHEAEMKLWRTAYSQWREVRKFLKEAPECISSKPGLAEAVGCLRANIDALMCGDRCFKSVTSLSPSWKAVIKLLKLKHALSKTDKLRVESFTKSLESLANGIRPTNDVAGAGLEVGVMDVDNIGRECRNETSSDSEKIKNEAAGNGFFRDDPIWIEDDHDATSRNTATTNIRQTAISLDDKGGREKKRNIATTNVEQTVISSDHKGGRVKKRKERADFVLWGDPQYQETQLKDLQETWRQVQEQFLAVKSAFKEVVKQDDLKLGATIYCLGVVMHEQSWRVEAGGCPSGSHLERKWNEVHQLRMKSGYVFDEEREAKAQHFGKLLAQLTSQAALHSFVTEYPNSIDHKRKKPRRKRQG